MNTYLLTLKTLSIIVFVSFIPLLLLVDNSTSIVWTMVVPVLPLLFLLIGYSNWRKVCPLAFFANLSQNLRWIQKRKVPLWFEENFYFFQYAILFWAFCARLIVLNFDTNLLASFFILVIVSAFLINLVYTGKTWCNFFCPVGVVEKIYCGSNAHQANTNSACTACSACKRNCPDIDMESNYWRESTNSQKTFVFYSFSGLVLGFYAYFYLQSGSYEYYFSGVWAHESLPLNASGFFFAPFIPLYLAVPITLAFFSLVSYAIFKTIEQVLWKKQVVKNVQFNTLQHRVKMVASFSAFNIFYVFAGAPSYNEYPTLYAIFYFLIVMVSAIVLHREFFREESFFLQERFAMKMLKRWDSGKDIPTNLKEIYYTYSNETKNKLEKLQIYKETIQDLLRDGILTENSMTILEKLRSQMGITQKEHLDTIKKIKLKNAELFDSNVEKSTEKRYQLNSYQMILENALEEHKQLDESYLLSLRKQFCITDEIHNKIMHNILHSNKKLQEDVLGLLKKMNALRRLHKSIFNDNSREISFLKFTIKNEFSLISKDLFILLDSIYTDHAKDIAVLKKYFKYRKIGEKIDFKEEVFSFMDPNIAKAILELKKDFDSMKDVQSQEDNQTIIKHLFNYETESIAIAAHLSAINDSSGFFNNLDLSALKKFHSNAAIELYEKIAYNKDIVTLYEKMMYMHNIPLFQTIKLYELTLLADLTNVVCYPKDTYIIKQGEDADTLFVITSGKVNVEVDSKVTNTLNNKDYFGAIAILSDGKRTASVVSITNVTMLTLTKEDFKNFVYEHPKISVKLMKDVISKLINNLSR